MSEPSEPNDLMYFWRENPLAMAECFWPGVQFYDKQKQIIESVRDDDETFVPAGNMLGKDFVSGFIALWYFIAFDPVRIVTTSVKDDHLRVLWGEINNFVRSAAVPLRDDEGGFLKVNHHDIRKTIGTSEGITKSYLRGMVSAKGEGMAGHHAEFTLAIMDEASGIDDLVYTQAGTWAKKMLVIGNPNRCNNFFYHGVKGGNIVAED